MAVISKFEDLNCWKKARVLCQQIYEATTKDSFSKASCAEVKSQLYRALDRKHIDESNLTKYINWLVKFLVCYKDLLAI